MDENDDILQALRRARQASGERVTPQQGEETSQQVKASPTEETPLADQKLEGGSKRPEIFSSCTQTTKEFGWWTGAKKFVRKRAEVAWRGLKTLRPSSERWYSEVADWSMDWTVKQERLARVYQWKIRRSPLWRSTKKYTRKHAAVALSLLVVATAAYMAPVGTFNLQGLSFDGRGLGNWVIGVLAAIILLAGYGIYAQHIKPLRSSERPSPREVPMETATAPRWRPGWKHVWNTVSVAAAILVLVGIYDWWTMPEKSAPAVATRYLPPPLARKVIVLPSDEALYTIEVGREGTATYRFPLRMMARIQAVDDNARFKVITEDGEFTFTPEHSDKMPGPTAEASFYSLSDKPIVVEIDIYPRSKTKTLDKKPLEPAPALPDPNTLRVAL